MALELRSILVFFGLRNGPDGEPFVRANKMDCLPSFFDVSNVTVAICQKDKLTVDQIVTSVHGIISEFNFFKIIFQRQVTADSICLTLFNFWRFERVLNSPQLYFYQFDVGTRIWKTLDNQTRFEGITLKGEFRTSSHNIAREKINLIITILVNHVISEHIAVHRMTVKRRAQLTQRAIKAIHERIISGITPSLSIDIKAIGYTVKDFIRCLRQDLIHHDFYSLVCAILYGETVVMFSTYLYFAQSAVAVDRVAKEHRNLLPLLQRIKSEYWNCTDLFSRHVWMQTGTAPYRDTLLQRYNDTLMSPPALSTPATYHYLMKAPLPVIHGWLKAGFPAAVFENLAVVANRIATKVPVIIFRRLLEQANSFKQVDVLYQRFMVAFIRHCLLVHQRDGWKVLVTYLRHVGRNELRDSLDWLNAEGVANQLPDKQATWQSIQRLQRQWHSRFQYDIASNVQAQRSLTWDSELEEFTLDGFSVRALTNSQALAEEGLEMHHCVEAYDEACEQGFYRIFALTSLDLQSRATLCIQQDPTDSCTWQVQQVRGVCNSDVDPRTDAVAHKIAGRYAHAKLMRLASIPALA